MTALYNKCVQMRLNSLARSSVYSVRVNCLERDADIELSMKRKLKYSEVSHNMYRYCSHTQHTASDRLLPGNWFRPRM